MAKIVYNACYGGFGISMKAAKFMAGRGHEMAKKELAEWGRRNEAVQAFIKTGKWPDTVCEIERSFLEIDAKYRKAASWFSSFSELERTDPLLVAAVEALGDKANGEYAKLRIRELPEGTLYRIDEYDGNESVMTRDDYDWRTA